MNKIFNFWEKIEWFKIKVLNEREVRASAWILFFFAMISFMTTWLTRDFYVTRIFVIAFLIDFGIRIFINPKYSPSLILWRFFVNNQKPEYVWAAQKKFAWILWLLLWILMFFLIVVNNVIWPINIIICTICIMLFLFETAFGICIWCIIYNKFNKKKAELCPWWSCEIRKKEEIQKINFVQTWIVILSIIWVVFLSNFFEWRDVENNFWEKNEFNLNEEINKENKENCVIPDWVKLIWHEEKYKLHHWCK